ncbi:DUF1203 domain-containing protein [Hasllibacter sp. MH4015]|uniref:DUF1203 domain-containing protein n=1 Tax=Hasllibacter sp. MH4015 TaxID=2854029 RepID=UPI001CD56699|nr:DUF1203 domain-containing protein [Hasllibacter sp. MH4015]
MSFRIRGLDPAPFAHLFGLSDPALAEHGAERHIATQPNALPDRITMCDAEPGEAMILLNHTYQPANSPYFGTHAIYVKEGAQEVYEAVDEIPPVMAHRLLSLRGFNDADKIEEGRVVPGSEATAAINKMFENPAIRYIHAHNAGHGCYAGLVERA